MAKHTLYYELQEALNIPGCAICQMGEKAGARYLQSLVYERANDYETRAEVKRARGFCNLHAWQLRDLHGAGLDVAILSGDILKTWLQAMEEFTSSSSAPQGWDKVRASLRLSSGVPDARALAEQLAPERLCLACEIRDTTERAYLHELLAHIHNPEIEARYVKAGGLCLLHFRQALEAAAKERQAQQLVELQTRALGPLLEELHSFINKHDYRFEGQMTSQEGESWLKALALLSGRRGTR